MRVGVLPAAGNGLVHMQRQGQLYRLFAHLEAYGGRCTYFSYMDDTGLWPARLGRLVTPKRPVRNPLLFALTRPFREREAFQACDVLRCTSLLGAIPALVAGIPFVVTYGADYLTIAAIHGRSRMHLRKWRVLQGVVMRRAKAVIVQNDALAERLRAQYPKATIRHIPNWVDTDRFKPSRRSASSVPGRMVLYVGRLVEEKNLVTLAWACRQVKADLVCLGTGPHDVMLKGLGAHCPGAIPWDALPSWHNTCDVFAMVSHTEGHCKALIEAMASGMPCVVSKAVTEGMIPGENCLQVDPTEPSIAVALEVLLADRTFAAKLGAGARRMAEVCWSKQTLLDRELELLEWASA